jgi:exopolysaccharide biosynthesis protein
VNGDFFAARNVKDAEGALSRYRPGQWAAAIGPAVTDGKTWSVSKKKVPCLILHKNGKPNRKASTTIQMIDKPPPDAWEVVAGNQMLVQDGKLLPHDNKDRHPRTVVGLNKTGTQLVILVVDGRRPGVSIGMTYEELGREMLRLGCWQALNLDGGGSSVMAIREPASGKFKIVNTPSDARERAVANVLGISMDGLRKPDSSRPARTK